MVYKFQVDKIRFQEAVKNRYAQYIKDGNITISRCYAMLACELDVCVRTIYNFTNNKYSVQLLMKLLQALNVDIEEIFMKE